MTKLGAKRIHTVRTRGGNRKFRALRLEAGNFSWGSETITRKTRVVDVVYNATNNELVRTQTLVKGCIVQIDATPFRQWFEAHYAVPLGRSIKKQKKAAEKTASGEQTAAATKEQEDPLTKKKSRHLQRKLASRKADSKIDSQLTEQFTTGRLYARITSRPGQSGRCDGYILEGQELAFYVRKLKSKRGNKE